MNEILLSVTNRATGFADPGLLMPEYTTGHKSFTPDSSTPELESIRSLMKLDPNQPDYFTKGILLAVEAYPEVKAGFDETGRSYDLKRLTRAEPSYTRCYLAQNRFSAAVIARHPDEWPVDLTITIAYIRSGVAGIRCGANFAEVHATYISDGRLEMEWPSWTGISGTLVL